MTTSCLRYLICYASYEKSSIDIIGCLYHLSIQQCHILINKGTTFQILDGGKVH